MSFSVLVSEVNLVGNTKEWWVDTGAIRHICSDKKMFSSYEAINDGDWRITLYGKFLHFQS